MNAGSSSYCSGSGAGSGSGSTNRVEEPHTFSKLFTRPPRHTSSKYDFVKVRVWLGDKSDHYYVLSRFLVSRMLTVTKIPHHVAIKISLELRKLLIDNSLLDVSQSDLEANLFKLMERRGYGAEYISRYNMMTRLPGDVGTRISWFPRKQGQMCSTFFSQLEGFDRWQERSRGSNIVGPILPPLRVPLIILVCGTASLGKSTIATQLAQPLNLPNVLQTDMVYEILRTATDAPLASAPIWTREFSSPEELITEFCRECRIVRKGLDGDLKKAMKDGKPVIIEGTHLDPAIYLKDEKNGGITSSQSKRTPLPDLSTLSVKGTGDALEADKGQEITPAAAAKDTGDQLKAEEAEKNPFEAETQSGNTSIISELSSCGELEEGKLGGTMPSDSQHLSDQKSNEQDTIVKSTEKAVSFAHSIVVPIVLKMADVDHQTLLQEWIASRSTSDFPLAEEQTEALMTKFQIIQDYISSFETQCIERGCAAPDTGTSAMISN